MYPDKAIIEIFRSGHWQAAGVLRPDDFRQGYRGSSRFEYLLDYAVDNAGELLAPPAGLSCRYPVDFVLHNEKCWPAFILDLLPSGHGRRQWLEQLDLNDGPNADWPLLLRGSAFPVGNLRVAEAVAAKNPSHLVPTASGELVSASEHPGFSRREIIERNEHFVEYAFQLGIYAAGGTDVQGVAPKMLLNEDLQGAWHAEGVLPDKRIKAHWLVKLPRGRTVADQRVLKNEAAYMSVAQALGLRVHGELEHASNSLFIPRFDRRVVAGSHVERYGMESLCSLAGVPEFGAFIAHDTLCRAISRYCAQPQRDLLEYIKRDIVNVVMGNKDNHARNTAVMRYENGRVVLAPLFDFAPMYLDPEGIVRVCRWEGDVEQAGNPDWGAVINGSREYLSDDAARRLRQFGQAVERLPETMRQAGVDDDIIESRTRSIQQHARQLRAL
jgi:serine/threonine-protein kinase HipA